MTRLDSRSTQTPLAAMVKKNMKRFPIIFLLAIIILALSFVGQAAPRRATNTSQYSLNLRNIKRISIKTFVGDVHVSASNDGTASFLAERFATDNKRLADTVVLIEPRNNELMIVARDASSDVRAFNDSGVNFEIVVPKSLEFRISTGEGNVSIEGVRGRFGVRSERGSFVMKNVRDVSLDVALARGAIELTNVQFAGGTSNRAYTKFGTTRMAGLWFFPNAQVQLETSVGQIECDMPGFKMFGKIWRRNGPGKLTALRVQTGLGNIEVQP